MFEECVSTGARELLKALGTQEEFQSFVSLQKASRGKLRQSARENSLEDCSQPQPRKEPSL